MKRGKIIILTVMLSCGCSAQSVPAEEIKQNVASLKTMEEKDMAKIEQKISAVQKTLERADGNDLSYTDMFRNTVVMGDSIAQGLVEYELLDPIQVIAERGKNVDFIDEDISRVIQMAPTDIFMEYGMNDLGYFGGNAQRFTARYEEQIKKLKEALPYTNIYINLILPIQPNGIAANPVYGNWTAYNDAMKEMCSRLKISFIDNASLISEHQISYERDGVHPMYAYYPLWLTHMAKELGF